MPEVIIVEDEVKVARLLSDYLVREGFETLLLHEGEHAVELILARKPALVVLDLMLPGRDGLSICRELRRRSELPVLILTARVDSMDRLMGLELGADDYVCKPFNPSEVVVRVKNILRRTQGLYRAPEQNILRRQGIVLDMERHRCEVEGEWVELTPVEFRLLQVMMARPGRVFSRDVLMELAYEDARVVSRRTIDSHVKNLRRKLEASGCAEAIRSIYGVGYTFEVS